MKLSTTYIPDNIFCSQNVAPAIFGEDGECCAGEYRFGFNGQETDSETGFQNYKFRMYDSRIARFFAVDPITKDYPELTPYQFASLSPIYMIELEGLEGVIIIEMVTQPKGLNKTEFASNIENRLIQNSAHKDTKVYYSDDLSFTDNLNLFFYNTGIMKDITIGGYDYKSDQSATKVQIRNYASGDPLSDKGGFNDPKTGKVVLYPGLNISGENKNSRTLPGWVYENALLHELGHEIYDFQHINHGPNKGHTKSGKGLMDYREAYQEGAEFDIEQQNIIWKKAQGIDAVSGEDIKVNTDATSN